jgi:hypothetical protein
VSVPASAPANGIGQWFDRTIGDLARHFRWSFLPPLMIYFAAGISGLTSIVGAFFVKDYLELSAAFLAGLGFWVGLPWVLKMPVGHLVDLIWRRKALLVWLGAGLIGLSLIIMYALIIHTAAMRQIMSVEAWYVLAVLLAPSGYVIQDVVADAMTVEAVPSADADGHPYSEEASKAMHTTMQTLGRFAIISGLVMVASLNIFMFADVESLDQAEKVRIYGRIYLMALAIPAFSVSGVVLAGLMRKSQIRRLRAQGLPEERISALVYSPPENVEPNWQILIGGLIFVGLSIAGGLSDIAFSKELVFAGSMAIVLFLISRLVRELPPGKASALIGTAVIIFVFRAVPLPGPGQTWFEIDVLGFDERFLSVLSLITSGLTLAGLVVLRPMMASRSIAFIIVLLTIAAGLLALPNIGLYYGIQDWTAAHTNGIVDARFIAILDTAIESPLGQVAMIPMLAWIAKNAPARLKATFFAVMASFTNLALSASSLATKYLNEILVVSREVRDRQTGEIIVPADYGNLGILLISVALISVAAPLLTILIVQASRFRTTD